MMIPEKPARPIKATVFSFVRPNQACALHRLLFPFQYLRDEIEPHWAIAYDGRNIRVDLRAVNSADVVIVQRQFPCTETAGILQQLLASGKPVIYETDDLMPEMPADNPDHHFAKQNRDLLLNFISRVSAVTVSTGVLVDAFSAHNKNVYLLPNLINETLWPQSITPKANDTVVIGFAGTPTHQSDLTIIEDALIRIADRHGNRVSFTFMGCTTERLSQLPGFRYIDFKPIYQEYARLLPSLGIDIAVVPLLDILFNHCKSDIKWLEYSLCGIPGVYSDLPPYQASVRHGHTGMLAAGNTDAWFQSLDYLISHKGARIAMAKEARREVLANNTLQVGAENYLHVYREVLAQKDSS